MSLLSAAVVGFEFLTESEKVVQSAVTEVQQLDTPVLKLDMFLTVTVAIVALLLGMFLRSKIKFLTKFCIPAPVIGGLIFAIIFCVLYSTGVVEMSFDETLKTICMNIFFTSVGFQASIKTLKSGGKTLIILLIAVTVLVVFQNLLAVGLGNLLGVGSLVGITTGSIPMVGGHGTSGAFGPILEGLGLESATTLCTSAATFGLVMGSLMGGPLASRLIEKKDLLKTAVPVEEMEWDENENAGDIKGKSYATAAFMILIAMGLGSIISHFCDKAGITFPSYIGGMVIAAIMRNVSEKSKTFETPMEDITDIGDICLSIFLGIAMITLKLWQLTELALPLIVLLVGQTVLMFLMARFVIFNIMGRDYDAAVITAGCCGFGMGATPNAMANMQTVTNKYAPSAKAYILVPLIGALFVDFTNSLIVTGFINFIK